MAIEQIKKVKEAEDQGLDTRRKSESEAKKILEELVAGEDSRHPLTDQQLSQCLQERGVKISRRTVAKYREELNIPSSTLRKRWA